MMAHRAAPPWPSGHGEMAASVRDFDWAKTSLGPIEAWPQSLKTVVDLALSAPQPMFVAAGADLICIYNDSYLPILGEQHPAMLGMPFAVAFAEIWEQLDLLVADTLKGNSHLVVDQSFALPWRPDQPQSWFTYSYTPFRDERDSVAGFLVVVTETTDRLLAERKLREDEERQAFLLKLSDALRPIADPFTVQQQASRILREHLGAGRVVYYETSGDEEVVSALAEDVANDIPSLLGRRFRWVDFEPGGSDMFRHGHSAGREDVQAEDSISPEQKAAFAATRTRAFMLTPLMKSGRLVASLVASFNVPHHWTSAEIRLLEETAERTWAAVERARAETALRESEERFRQFANAASGAGWIGWIRGVDTLDLEFVSPVFEDIYGMSADAVIGDVRKWAALIVPDDREGALERLEQVRKGQAVTHEFRIRRASDGAFRWIKSTDFPLSDEQGRVQRVAGIASDITEVKQSAEHQAILLAELQHRVRNIMAMIHSMTIRTAHTAQTVPNYADLMRGRLMALARTQALLTQTVNVGVDIGTLFRKELATKALDEAQYQISGPDLVISPKAAEVLSLAIHELATNALKYGALAVPEGVVSVTWRVADAEKPLLSLLWSETRLPVTDWVPPARRGFGTELIEQRVPYELAGHGKVEITPQGAQALIEFPLQPGTSILETDAPAQNSVSGGSIDMNSEPGLAGQCILVLEDDYYVASDVASTLRGAGADVVGPFPLSGPAIEAVRQGGLTGAVVDINLGSGPSFETAHALGQAGVPFIFLTGYDQRAIPDEFDGIPRLEKPVEPRRIVRALDSLIGASATNRQSAL
jgi:PAS domain S-box-containing protein